MINKLLFIFSLLVVISTNAQVKIGVNPSLINPSSILELDSPDKFIVITRMSDTAMLAATPLEGAMVYNTTTKCVYVFKNPSWKSLCDSGGVTLLEQPTAPISPNKGDVWINGNVTSGWDGTKWLVISKSISNGNGTPQTQTNLTNPKAGDLYIDNSTGDISVYNATTSTWVNKSKIKANNGLTYDATTNTVSLGGKLDSDVEIDVNSKKLKIKNLQTSNPADNDNFLTIDKTTGQLKQITMASSILREDVVTLTAVDYQVVFATTLYTIDKINVFRNGVRIDFQVDKTNNKITLEPKAKCYAGDKIKIVQLY